MSAKSDQYARAERPKALRLRTKRKAAELLEEHTHIYYRGAVCETDKRGHPEPDARSPLELVVDATEGFIPLWDEDVTLRWRFHEQSMLLFVNPDAAREYLRALFAEGIRAWGGAHPVRFTEVDEAWDFEIAVSPAENCSPLGCTLARAFFPDSGQHDLLLYPTLFEQTLQEQVETLAHELGHVFGLRHFFAQIQETAWRSEIFGTHSPFSIMNYGEHSVMTQNDRDDLRTLYRRARDGSLTNINGTPIRLVQPFSAYRSPAHPVGLAARL